MSEELIQLEWSTVQRKVSDLVPSYFNPRKTTEAKLKKLQESIEKFNIVEIPTIDFDNDLLSYHQRIKVLFILGRGEETIDCRKPNRKLTEDEFKELMLQLNIHTGDFDFSEVEEYFQDFDFERIGMEVDFQVPTSIEDAIEEETKKQIDGNKEKEIKEIEIRPYAKTHVLLSFPPEKILDIKEHLEKIVEFDFVEYEQSSN